MDERKWIESILAGDTERFSCLVDAYQNMAFSVAYRILENREDAEEVVQDAFVKMYRALPTFRFNSKFSTWFYRIVYHTALTYHKQQVVFPGYEELPATGASGDEFNDASALLEREDRREIIDQVLKKLPKDEALLLSLYYLQECSIEDIRQITNLTLSNIKTKLFRGRKRFYELIQQVMKNEKVSIL